MKLFTNLITLSMGGAIALAGYSVANAEEYPTRPISVAACYPAGGGVDRNLRMVERVAAKYLEQPLLPQYKTGGSGTVAMQYLKAADPDGYELAICDNGGSIIAPVAQGLELGPDDVTPIAQVSFVPWILTARAEAGYETLEDFINAAKASDTPTPLEISDLATSDHFGFLLLIKEAGLSPDSFKWNPHGGGGPKMRAILANEGDLLLEDAGEIEGYVRAGTLVPLAVAATERLPQFPDVPTMRELGYDVVAGMSTVLFAPAGMAPERLETLRNAMRQVKDDPDLIAAFELTAQNPETFIVDGFEESWKQDWNNAKELLEAVLKR